MTWVSNLPPNDRPFRVGMQIRWKGLGIVHDIVGVGPSGIRVKPRGKASIVISSSSEVEIRVDKEAPFIISSETLDEKGEHMGVSQVPVAENSTNSGGPCICGCGELVTGYFKRGHVSGFNGNLRRIAAGDDTPTRLLGRSLAMRLGPWTDTKTGQVPSKGYRDLR